MSTNPPTPTYGIDELMITCMARALNGEVLVSAVTAFGLLAGRLAHETHAPDLGLLSTPESGLDALPIPTFTLGQFITIHQHGIPLSMEDVFDAIFTDRFRIWINPAQVDQWGNSNISVIGPWDHPKVAMVGSRGIPEDTSHLSQILYYLPQHTTRSVVAAVDFRSGAGNGSERDTDLGKLGAPTLLVTNLGVFRFDGPNGSLRPESLHPGVTPEMVQQNTAFPVEIPKEIPSTVPPSYRDLQIIREADPLEVRKWEIASGNEARERFQSIYMHEAEWLSTSPGTVR